MWAIKVLIVSVLIVASVRDTINKEIDIKEIIVLLGLMLGYAFMDDSFDILYSIFGALFGVCMILFSKISKQALGLGDAIVLLILGIGFGVFRTIYVLMVALILSSVIATGLIVLKKAGRKTQLPFIPHLSMGVIVMMVTLK